MDVIEEIGQYVTDELSADFAAQIWEEFSLNSANPGTVILINNFKKTEREKDAIARIKRWVGKTYTKDLDSGRISVEINGDIINPSCPVGTDLLGRGAVINKFPILYSGEKNC
jgi:hypothetical protein